MSKDKVFGFFILLFGILVIVVYIFWGPLSLIYSLSGGTSLAALGPIFAVLKWEWAVVIPMTLAVVLFGLLAAWIGYSMITTPPPVPLEELEEELEAEEKANKEQEQKTATEPEPAK